MVRLHTDVRMLEHLTPPRHPERPERLRDTLRHIERTGLASVCHRVDVRRATDEELLRVHSPEHLAGIATLGRRGGGQIEADTWLSAHSEEAGRLAAGAVIQAVEGVLSGTERRAFCVVRPPGHHARPSGPMGFCLYANVAVGAAAAVQQHGLGRVLIVDWDVHHGNGTQEIFYEDPRVAFLSIHRYPFYPGSGAASETGRGRGLGSTVNVPLAYGVSRLDFKAAFRSALHELADRIRPELVLVSAGFDAHAEDPVGDLGLETEDFVDLTHEVLSVAETHAQGRIVSVLEGGYNVPILCGCVEAHLRTLASGEPQVGG